MFRPMQCSSIVHFTNDFCILIYNAYLLVPFKKNYGITGFSKYNLSYVGIGRLLVTLINMNSCLYVLSAEVLKNLCSCWLEEIALFPSSYSVQLCIN